MMLAFGPFIVDPVRRVVTKNGTPLRLTLRCTELLIALVRNAGKTLSKQELIEQAWPDPQASDATLAQHVFLLRRALAHDDRGWIRTIANVGYCFTGSVAVLESAVDERTHALRTYLQGARTFRDLGTEPALRSAIDLCSRAIALDETIAEPYALRASCWRLLAESMYAEPLPCLQAAKSDAEAALACDAADADARLEAAHSAALLDRDFASATRHTDAVLRSRPNHPALPHLRVWIALMAGRREEALRIARSYGGSALGAALYMSHDFTRAREIFDRYAESDPASRVMRGACRLFTRDAAGALEDFKAVYYADPAGEGGIENASARHYALGLYIYALAKAGRVTEARAHIDTLEALTRTRYVSPMVHAAAHLGLAQADCAIACVDEALRRFDTWSAYVLVDPLLDELRGHPRFSALARSAA